MKVTKPEISNVGPGKFFAEARTELKKVTWPTRQETIKLTMIVVLISSLVALFIGGLDAILLQVTAVLFK